MELHPSLSIVLASSVEGGVNTARADMRDAVHCADWCRPFQPLMRIANRTILQLVMPGNLFLELTVLPTCCLLKSIIKLLLPGIPCTQYGVDPITNLNCNRNKREEKGKTTTFDGKTMKEKARTKYLVTQSSACFTLLLSF